MGRVKAFFHDVIVAGSEDRCPEPPETDANPRAVIGGNQPPEPTPFEIAEKRVADAYDEARLWLDGAKVADQETADGIANLLKLIRDARKLADEHRKAEKEPHDKAAAEVQARYKPLLDRADLAASACKKALEPWLVKLAAEVEAAARKAREEAEAKQRAAQEAIRAADAANLEARAAAEALVKDAKKAEVAANKAERQTATAGGSIGRATGLRTISVAVMTDAILAARHYWKAAPDEMRAFLQGCADRDVRLGKRDIPGFEIREEHKAV